MSHDHTPDVTTLLTQAYWDARYGSADQMWSGNANPRLVEHVADLSPGTALDVGSGEGVGESYAGPSNPRRKASSTAW